MKHELSHILDIYWCRGRYPAQQDDGVGEYSLRMGGGRLQVPLGPFCDGTAVSWGSPIHITQEEEPKWLWQTAFLEVTHKCVFFRGFLSKLYFLQSISLSQRW